jgi:putative hydrolase of the HAD superfamily
MREPVAGIRAVIFDVAGVLTASPRAVMESKADEAGVQLFQMLPIMLGPLDEDTDHPFHRAERGELDFASMCAEMTKMAAAAGIPNVPLPPTGAEMVEHMTPIQPMVSFVREVKDAGYLVGVLTNNIAEWGRWRDNVRADELGDVVIDSCEVGLRKPNPAIFQLMLERLGGLAPVEALFLDDFPWNVAAAAALGLHTIQVGDTHVAIAEARSMLGLGSED